MANVVYWCLQQSPEPSISRASLSPTESSTYEGFRFEARRKSWLVGRFTAKTLVSKVHPGVYRPDQIEIRNNDLGAPCAYTNDQPLPGCLSISHSGDWAAAAYAPELRVGIDLETISSRSDGFIQDYFTKYEVEWILTGDVSSSTRTPNAAERATLIWSAKEALLKALGIGLRLDTRQVEVIAIEDEEDREGWKRLRISIAHPNLLSDAYWRQTGLYMTTLVVLIENHQKAKLVQIT